MVFAWLRMTSDISVFEKNFICQSPDSLETIIAAFHEHSFLYHVVLFMITFSYQHHRRDSIQGTDYIADYLFLNLSVPGIKIENLK